MASTTTKARRSKVFESAVRLSSKSKEEKPLQSSLLTSSSSSPTSSRFSDEFLFFSDQLPLLLSSDQLPLLLRPAPTTSQLRPTLLLLRPAPTASVSVLPSSDHVSKQTKTKAR
ncbi:hypothetical protein LWI29_015783 [Acer saccharum]|uniref:Uncharacterized protein n=1 Tax=Acer saccharum TaxID=4024 RepID=A0AA39RRT9_ACESA|nr:hypothetical protein LWI29_015783 [Acer saccharum]